MKKTLFVTLMVFSTGVFADAPYMNNNTAESRERVQNGEISCETSKAQTTVNMGVYGSNGEDYYYSRSDKGGYVGISIPIGDGGGKVDCNRLFELSVKEKELKIKQLEQQVAMLEARTLSVAK